MLPYEIKRRWPGRPRGQGRNRNRSVQQPPAHGTPAALTPWYLAGGVTPANCIAVYDPWGAKNTSKARENVVNPGTYDAADGVAPAWAKGTGWTFNGTTQYLRCNGLNAPNTNAWTYICWYKNITGLTGVVLGATDSSTFSFTYLSPNWNATTGGRWSNDTTSAGALDATPATTEGVIAMAGGTGYLNGVSKGSLGAAGGNNGWEIYIGARNSQGITPANFLNGTVCRVAIYNTVLTGDQVKAITRAIRTLAVGFGDSIMLGSYYVTEEEKLFNIICTTKGYEKQNSGIGSTTLQNTTQNAFPVFGGAVTNNGRDRYLTDVVNYTPKWVFILYGLNDVRINDASCTAALFENDLGEIIDGLIASGVAPGNIVIGSPTYIPAASYALYPNWDGGSLVEHAAHVAAALAVATVKNTRYVDVYAAMLAGGGDSLIAADGIHPNAAGHAVIAEAFLSSL